TYTISSGTHPLSVGVSGTKNPVSAGPFIIFDAFVVPATPTVVGPGTYEDTDSNLAFSGSWTGFADPGASGGSAKYSGQTGASVGLVYGGSALTVVFIKQSNTGIATVTIDGVVVDQLDTYSATHRIQQQQTYTRRP